MTRIQALMLKEWQEAIKNRIVLYTGIFLPVLFVILPLMMLFIGRLDETVQDIDDAPPGLIASLTQSNLTPAEAIQAWLGASFMPMFLVIPLAIPVTIAAYSVVGEKQQRSLEALLSTPISVTELLAAKAVAAAIPGVVATWTSFALYTAIAWFVVISPAVWFQLVQPTYVVMILVIAPLATVLAVTLGLIVSSRVNDPRTAEQLAMMVVLPVIAILISQMAGLFQLNLILVVVGAIFLAVIDVILVMVGVQVFERETILTRWR